MFDLDSIKKGAVNLPPRIILLGVPKVGKSTFASQAPDAIVIPVKGEEGMDDLDVSKFPTVNTFDELMQALGTLCTQEHSFKNLVIDSTSALEKLIWAKVCEVKGWSSIEDPGFGKGYAEVDVYWQKLTDTLDWLRSNKGMASIMIGHVLVKPFKDPESESYDTYQFDIHKNASAMLQRWCDSTLFANRKAVVKKDDAGFNKKEKTAIGGDTPYLFTQARPAHPGGGRGVYGRLPYQLDLHWEAFMAAVSEAIGNGS